MRFLILYELIPEITRLYTLALTNENEIQNLLKCHGRLSGLSDCPEYVEEVIGRIPEMEGIELLWESLPEEQRSPPKLHGSYTLICTGCYT